jgi:hypothetical protein
VLALVWNMKGEASLRSEPEGSGRPAKLPEYWDALASGGAMEGARNQSAAALFGKWFSLNDVFDSQAVSSIWTMATTWNKSNDPPLAEKELKTTFESILRREREKRLNADHQSTFSRATRRDPDTGRVVDEGWRLIIVTSDPPRYKVFSPLWEGFIDVGSTEMRSPEAICRAALEQCRVWIPGNFSKIWRGDKKNPSLAQQLMESAEIEEDADESRRPFLIAEMLYGFLTEMPKKISPGEEFDSRGLPCTTDRGDYVFKFTEAWRPMCRSDLKVRSHELTRLLRSLGCRPFFPTIAGRRYRLNLLQAEGFEQLRSRIMDVQ